MFIIFTLILTALLCVVKGGGDEYIIGAGIGDITGPSVEINFMGYAVPGQRGSGIHLRLRSRAFVFEQDGEMVCYVSVDGGMSSDNVKLAVMEKLNAKYGDGVFFDQNVAIGGTHTHSGPAGFLAYVLYQMTSLGFVEETFNAWVDGIYQSIVNAYEAKQPASILISEDTLGDDANINRSPTSYLLNPQEERDMYPDGDTDKGMTLLKIMSKQNPDKILGMLNWFAVHGTSMNNTNTLVSGDNKGYAGYVVEKAVNEKQEGGTVLPGEGPFVGAFASSNLGDVSPNTAGAKCIDTGEDCDGSHSTCNGRCEKCIAFGPGKDMTESAQIIGQKQADFAFKLMGRQEGLGADRVSGPVDFRHTYVHFPTLNVTTADGTVKELCSPAMGYAFAAGTTDGPGMFGFEQGTTTGNPFWNKVRDFLEEPTDAEISCQAPKPILLNTGDMEKPYAWDPHTIPLQILRVGQLFIVAVPSELTTMSGRRVRAIVRDIVQPILEEGQKAYIVISGLTNGYSSYVATPEEYQAQRYEAASTIYGPNTLLGYMQELTRIAKDMASGKSPSETGPPPPDMMKDMIQMMPLAHPDRHPVGKRFGSVLQDAQASYSLSAPKEEDRRVLIVFQGANPRNNPRAQGTYLTVDLQGADGEWATVLTDGDWNTKFHWLAGLDDKYAFGFSRLSKTTLEWNIDASDPNTPTSTGTYRMCYHGDHQEHKGTIKAFSGCSSPFQVTP
jgi:neutral ceramidase